MEVKVESYSHDDDYYLQPLVPLTPYTDPVSQSPEEEKTYSELTTKELSPKVEYEEEYHRDNLFYASENNYGCFNDSDISHSTSNDNSCASISQTLFDASLIKDDIDLDYGELPYFRQKYDVSENDMQFPDTSSSFQDVSNSSFNSNTAKKDGSAKQTKSSSAAAKAAQKLREANEAEKPFDCPTCKKKFKTKCSLQRHDMLHTGVRPFACTICGKGFIQKIHLKSHEFSHTGESWLKCHVCKKKFTKDSELKQHELTHS